MSDALKIKNLSVKYAENIIFDDVYLTIPASAITSIVGMSGIGKTTLLNCISSLIAYNGDITYLGNEIDKNKITIGYVGQSFGCLNWKKVIDNITLPSKLKNHTYLKDDFDFIIENLSLKNLLNRYPATLSGGEKQRVKLASIFLLKCNIILLDEPFVNLDIISSETAQDMFLSLWKTYKPTTIIVTHNINEALYLGHDIIQMSGSNITTLENPFQGNNEISMDKSKLYEKIKTNIARGGLQNEKAK